MNVNLGLPMMGVPTSGQKFTTGLNQYLVPKPDNPTATRTTARTTAPTPTTQSTGNMTTWGSGTRTATTTPAYVDPYARWGGRAAYDSEINKFNTQKAGILDSAGAAGSAGASAMREGIYDFSQNYARAMGGINDKAVTADLAKMTGGRDILGMVGRGIKSSGTMLANKNASNSSAGAAIAEAYGDIGQREMNKVGNAYAEDQREIVSAQDQLALDAAAYQAKIGRQKEDTLAKIVNESKVQLAALDAAMAGASMPQRIQIAQEMEAVKQRATGELSKYDSLLQQELGKSKRISSQDQQAQAAERSTAGYDLGEGAYDYSTQAPVQFQNTGPYSSNLPLFTFPRNSRED